jgi:hypothetical protein
MSSKGLAHFQHNQGQTTFPTMLMLFRSTGYRGRLSRTIPVFVQVGTGLAQRPGNT